MAFESLTAGYPVVGAFIGTLLIDNPDAVSESIREAALSEDPFADHPLDNEELCEKIAFEMTSSVEVGDDWPPETEAFLDGVRWAVVVANNADTEYATIIRLGYNEPEVNIAQKTEDIYMRSLDAIANFAGLGRVVEECLPVIDPENKHRAYCRMGMYVGFLLIDNGYRETVKRELLREALFERAKHDFSTKFTFVAESWGEARYSYGQKLN